jgi:hypothetical protein
MSGYDIAWLVTVHIYFTSSVPRWGHENFLFVSCLQRTLFHVRTLVIFLRK